MTTIAQQHSLVVDARRCFRTLQALEEECKHEMFVLMPWERVTLAVPLSQLKVANHVDEETEQAVEDWRYWIERGYQF